MNINISKIAGNVVDFAQKTLEKTTNKTSSKVAQEVKPKAVWQFLDSKATCALAGIKNKKTRKITNELYEMLSEKGLKIDKNWYGDPRVSDIGSQIRFNDAKYECDSFFVALSDKSSKSQEIIQKLKELKANGTPIYIAGNTDLSVDKARLEKLLK